MIKVVHPTSSCEYSEVYDIKFTFAKGKYNSYACETIITFDTESSNGYQLANNVVIGWDGQRYVDDECYHNMIDNAEPVALLYFWQCAVECQDGVKVFTGRTYEELIDFEAILYGEIRRQAVYGFKCINRASETYNAMTSKNSVKCKVHVHNLGHDYQFLRNIHNDDFVSSARCKREKVFAREARRPMKAYFNCQRVQVNLIDSSCLVHKSLANWCKDSKLPITKREEPKGFYDPIRSPRTQLTQEEIQYAIDDVVSMVYGIEQYRNKYRSLWDIPLTQTGEVRRVLYREVCEVDKAWAQHCYELTQNYTEDLYLDLVKTFAGGSTHANCFHVDKKLPVRCFDLASSYPAVMCTRRLPIGQFEDCDPADFDALASQDIHTADYRWMCEITLNDVVANMQNHYISVSKCSHIEGQIIDNGRVVMASTLTMRITDLDWEIIKHCYTFDDNVTVRKLRKSKAGYLSNSLIKCVLKYFGYKTSLKGLEDSYSLYVESKQMINSIYGAEVTKLISDIIHYNGEGNGWSVDRYDTMTEAERKAIFDATIEACKPEKAFSAYQFGVWITAWARWILWSFIIHFDTKIVYYDTDSIKGLFDDDDVAYVEQWNKDLADLETRVAHEIGIDPTLYTATSSKGKVLRIGVMEREHDCTIKTLGAKRYAVQYEENGEQVIEVTVAGLPKSAGVDKIKSLDMFNNQTVWNANESGKLICYYQSNQRMGQKWYDRNGDLFISDDQYGVCLKPTSFDLSMSEDFDDFLDTLNGHWDRDKFMINNGPITLRA